LNFVEHLLDLTKDGYSCNLHSPTRLEKQEAFLSQ